MRPEILFAPADRARFTIIKSEIARLLPESLPCSEAVHALGRLFSEVRDRDYQRFDEEQVCEEWMHKLHQIGPHQAIKYFKVALLPAAEVAGRRQGIEVMYQMAQEESAEVREAMWRLAEKERVSATALCAGRRKMQSYLSQGRHLKAAEHKAGGIQALVRAARQRAITEEKEREQRRATVRSAGARIKEGLVRGLSQLEKVREGKEKLSKEEARDVLALVRRIRQFEAELERLCAKERTFETSAEPAAKGGKDGAPAPETVAIAEIVGVPPAREQERTFETSAEPANKEGAEAAAVTEPVAETRVVGISPEDEQEAGREMTQDPVATVTAAAIPLQIPPEVLAFRRFFRFFHEGLTPNGMDHVQSMLCNVIHGVDPQFCVRDLHRNLGPFLHASHPMKKELTKLGKLLRGDEQDNNLDGRRFALHCLVAARLPGCRTRLWNLSQSKKLPEPLGELVRFYRDLLLGPCFS